MVLEVVRAKLRAMVTITRTLHNLSAALALVLLYGAIARLDAAHAERESQWRRDYYARLSACDPQRNASAERVRACLEGRR